jgi:Cu-Zn family superoxide dismutase
MKTILVCTYVFCALGQATYGVGSDAGGSTGFYASGDADGGDTVKNYAEMEFTTQKNCGYLGKSDCTAGGTMYMEELTSGTTRMYGLFYNLYNKDDAKDDTASKWDIKVDTIHAAHIHMSPPTAAEGCGAVGGVWDGQGVNGMDATNGFNHDHGAPYDQFRKLGDLGGVTITSSTQGSQSQFMLFDDVTTLEGPFSVVGRSMNIHYDPYGDDFGQYKPTTVPPTSGTASAKEMGKFDVSKAVGMHDVADDPNLANAIACGEIKQMTPPTVDSSKTANMKIDTVVSTASDKDYSITGTLTFESLTMPSTSSFNKNLQSPSASMTRITGVIYGLPDGLHGFHVHQGWDGKDCGGTGFIFDPENIAQIPGGTAAFNPAAKVIPANLNAHGAPADAYKTSADSTHNTRMAGDLGNIIASSNGQANIFIMDPVIQLSGANSIVGHSIDIHPMEDKLQGPLPDLDASAPNPLVNAGGVPIACGQIKAGDPSNPSNPSTPKSANLSGGAIAAIIIGVLAAAGAAAFIFFRSAAPENYEHEELRLELEKGGNNL